MLCAHDSPGYSALARVCMQQKLNTFFRGKHHLFKFGPKRAWFLGRERVLADKVHADTDIVPLLLVFIRVFLLFERQFEEQCSLLR